MDRIIIVGMAAINVPDEALKASFNLAVSGAVLAAGWLVGQRLAYKWGVRQKRREVQLTVSQQFYSAYGEFFAVWKLWNRLDRAVPQFDERRWELHKRAATAESVIEAILVKLSSELTLSSAEIAALGMFRQAYQQLRQVIRKDVQLPWTYSEHPEYEAYKRLAANVASLLTKEWPTEVPRSDDAASQLKRVTANEWEGVWMSRPSSIG